MAQVLIPTDFSDNALNAAVHAVRFFQEDSTKFVLLNCYYMPHGRAGGFRNMDGLLKEDSTIGLEEFKKRLIAAFPDRKLDLTTESEAGRLVDVLGRFETDPVPPDVVVQGTQGATGLKRVLMGSNTAAVIMRSRTPVLAIPEESVYTVPKKIVVLDDGGKVEKESIQVLLDIAAWSKAEVLIVQVCKADEELRGSSYDTLLGTIPHRMERLVSDEPIKALNDLVDSQDADLVVVLHRRKGLFESIFRKSMASRLVMHTHMPLLVMQQRSS